MNNEQTKKVTEFIMNQEEEITNLRSRITELNNYIKELKEKENEYLNKDLELVKYKMETDELNTYVKDLNMIKEQYEFKISFFKNQINTLQKKVEKLEGYSKYIQKWANDKYAEYISRTKIQKQIRDLLVQCNCISAFDDDNTMIRAFEKIMFNKDTLKNLLNKHKLKNIVELENILKKNKSIESSNVSVTPENNNTKNDKDYVELFHYRIQDIVKKGFNSDTLYNIAYNIKPHKAGNKDIAIANTPENIHDEKDSNSNNIVENYRLNNENVELLHYRIKEIVQKGFNTNVLYDIINKNNKQNTPRKPKKPTNQVQVVDNIIRKIRKNTRLLHEKNNDYYNIIYTKNRTDIDFYTTIYNDKNFKDIPSQVDIKLDKNTPRLDRTCGILNFIKNNPALYNSEYIFNYYTFKSVNNTGLEYLYEQLLNLCPTVETNNDSWESDTEHNICIDDNCDNYVPIEGTKCKNH